MFVMSLMSHTHKVLSNEATSANEDEMVTLLILVLVLSINKAVKRCLLTLSYVYVCLYRMIIKHYVFIDKVSVES